MTMMRCKKVLERLDDHVDGLLAAPEAEAVRDHLDACVDCRETSAALTAATSSLSKWHDAEPPADCFDKILSRIDNLPAEALAHSAPRGFFSRLPRFESVRTARIRWFATSGLAAAAAVLAAVQLPRVETRGLHRAAPRASQPVSGGISAASWYQGYDFDNGLFYRGQGRPAMQPVRAGSRTDLLLLEDARK
jgi:anti-sigma factor RsiW